MADAETEVPMKTFVDSAKPSLFSIDVPKRFFAIRRSSKGGEFLIERFKGLLFLEFINSFDYFLFPCN